MKKRKPRARNQNATGKSVKKTEKVKTDEQIRSKFTEEYLVQWVVNKKKEYEDATKSRRKAWKELWQLYQNKQATKKKKWQSKCFFPKVFTTVNEASALVERAIMQTSKLFNIEELRGMKPVPDELMDSPGFKGELSSMIEKIDKNFKDDLEDSNFTNAYSEGTKSAFLLGLGAIKGIWRNGAHYYENVDVLNLFIDPNFKPYEDQNPAGVIEYKKEDLARLLKKAKMANEGSGEDVYRNIDKIVSGGGTEEEEEEASRKGLDKAKSDDKGVEVLEYWGDVISEDGQDILENQLLVVTNDNTLIRWQTNPFKHAHTPFYFIIPLVYPHRGCAGTSLAEPVVKMQYTLNNIINMAVDNLNFSVNKMFEVQLTNAQNPHQLNDVYPGKLINRTGSGQVLSEVKTSGVGQDVFNMYDLLSKEVQNATAVTEFISGQAGRGKRTATEVDIKTGQSQNFFDVIARGIERNSLKRILIDSYALGIQFKGYPGQSVRIKVGGVSLMLRQREQIEKLTNTMAMALKVPVLQQSTDIRELWRRFLDIQNLSDVYKEQSEQGVNPNEEQPGTEGSPPPQGSGPQVNGAGPPSPGLPFPDEGESGFKV